MGHVRRWASGDVAPVAARTDGGERGARGLEARGVGAGADLSRELSELARLAGSERLLCVSRAAFGTREGPLAVVAGGHDADESGVLAVTGHRLLYVGPGPARLAVDHHRIVDFELVSGPGGRRDLRVVTVAGTAVLHGVGGHVAPALHRARRSAPDPASAAPAALAPPAPRRPAAPGRRDRAEALLRSARAHWPAPAALAGAALWAGAVASVETGAVGDAGLASALGPGAIGALALACAAIGVLLARARSGERTRALALLGLVVVLFGAPSVIGEVASFNVTWRHAGISTYIAEHGAVDPSINAYFNWPGFFILEALAAELAGLESALGLARWTPLVLNLLYLPPLLLIARSASDDPRFPWLAAAVFYLGNWVYQDYASPQGLMYVMYLGLVAIVLTWLRGRGRDRDERRRQAALVVACFLLVLVTVATHQLTPFAMLAAAGAIVLLRGTSFRALPAIVAVLTATWVVFAAGAYLHGHIDELKEQVGQIGATISSSVGSRVSGSPEHVLVTRLRLLSAVALWGLALVAALRALRRRDRRLLPHVALAAAPFALVLLQAYGGEIVLRVYMFSLPFAAVLVASLAHDRARSPSVAGVALAVALAAVAFVVTRYGNLRIELFTAAEVRTVERAYQIAPEGALLLAPNPQLPWEFARIGELRQRTIDGALRDRPPPSDLAAAVEQIADGSPAYVLITRNTRDYEELFGRPRWGTIAELERALTASPRFRRVVGGRDGSLYAHRPDATEAAR